MKKTILYKGGPGCGKTYKAIKEAEGDFVIAVPCRQLAYEIYWDYPQEVSRVDTGEVHMGDYSAGQVCVYESLSVEVIEADRLIIDEAHYINDPERGADLLEKILTNREAGKEIILLTATDTLSREVKELLDVEEVTLNPFVTPPVKKEIEIEEFKRKVQEGMTVIVFTKYALDKSTVESYVNFFEIDEGRVAAISANTPTYQRVKTQLDFKQGELQVVVSSNVLAQGVNFPAQGVLIEYNEYDDWEIIIQKLGRIARPSFGLQEGYYCLYEIPEIPDRRIYKGIPQKQSRRASGYVRPSREVVDIRDWGFDEHLVPYNFNVYKGYKYSRGFLEILRDRLGALEPAEQQALDFLLDQEQKLVELLETRPSK